MSAPPNASRPRANSVGSLGPAIAWAVAALSALAVAPPATAQVRQPDGTAIPAGRQLQDIFDALGDPVDAVADAAVTPETFVPECTIRFELLARGAGYRNAFGWYNVVGRRPLQTELYTLHAASDAVGAGAELDIRADARYMGGAIGFWLHSPEGCPSLDADPLSGCGYTYFTERAYNDDGGGSPDPWIHRLIYDSRVESAAFYFGWEDLFRGGDNDFDDLFTIVHNIVCSGAGGACDTGMPGICARGTQQCRAGALECLPERSPGVERCDALDEDCDGVVDEGDLCGTDEVCRAGRCYPRCNGIEFPCPGAEQCDEGLCVDPACVGVSCAAGEVCRDGVCAGACEGVSCPLGQACSFGRCLDPCEGVTCDMGAACEDGVCRTHCDCRGCADGMRCAADGTCVEAACVDVSCAAGTVCRGGACVDACAGASCPRGEECREGRCELIPPTPDAGPSPRPDAGPPPLDASGSPDAGPAGDDAGAPRMDGGAAPPISSGCGCRTAAPPGSSPVALWVALALMVLQRRHAGAKRGRRAPRTAD